MRPIHLSTVLAKTPSALLSHITHLSERYSGRGHTLLFALSSNFPQAKDLQEVVGLLTRFHDTVSKGASTQEDPGGHTIGCLTDPFSSVDLSQGNSGLSKTISSQNSNRPLSCAIGIFDSAFCVPFYSPLPGRTQPQVGRWHSFRKKAEEGEENVANELGIGSDFEAGKTNWEEVWNRSTTTTQSILPEALRSTLPTRIETLLHLSVPQPDKLTQALLQGLPSIPSVGLVAAPTHFVTGRGVTLFLDGRIYGEGAVGLALLKDINLGAGKLKTRTEFLGVEKLSGPLTITSTEGNMVNSLNGSNPTQLLLRAIDAAGVSSSSSSRSFKDDEEFALGVVAPTGEISRTYKITAGDPAHRGGSISLESDQAPAEGTVVQFLHRSSSSSLGLPGSLLTSPSKAFPARKRIAFITVPEVHDAAPSASSTNSHDSSHSPSLILPDVFMAPSHTGFVLSNAKRASQTSLSIPADVPQDHRVDGKSSEAWSCSMPGGVAILEWD